MSNISLRLPDSLHKQVREIAKQDGVSINQFAATAIAEKIAALLTREYLEQRAGRGSRDRFVQALAKVPATPPETQDAVE